MRVEGYYGFPFVLVSHHTRQTTKKVNKKIPLPPHFTYTHTGNCAIYFVASPASAWWLHQMWQGIRQFADLHCFGVPGRVSRLPTPLPPPPRGGLRGGGLAGLRGLRPRAAGPAALRLADRDLGAALGPHLVRPGESRPRGNCHGDCCCLPLHGGGESLGSLFFWCVCVSVFEGGGC